MNKIVVSLMALALVVSFGTSIVIAKDLKLKKVWEAKLEPSPGTILINQFRGVQEAFPEWTTARGKQGESKTKAKIETDFNGYGVAKVQAKGLCPAPECGGEFPVGDFSVEVFCGDPATGGTSVIYPGALHLDRKGKGKATVDISAQLPCADPAVTVGNPLALPAFNFWIAAPIVP